MVSKFQAGGLFRGTGGVYVCRVCEKKTRETGHSESGAELCAFCFEEAGLENSLADGIITQEEFDKELASLRKQYKRADPKVVEKLVAERETLKKQQTEAALAAPATVIPPAGPRGVEDVNAVLSARAQGRKKAEQRKAKFPSKAEGRALFLVQPPIDSDLPPVVDSASKSNPQQERNNTMSKTNKKNASKKPSARKPLSPEKAARKALKTGVCLFDGKTPTKGLFAPGNDAKLHSAVLTAFKEDKKFRANKRQMEYLNLTGWFKGDLKKAVVEK